VIASLDLLFHSNRPLEEIEGLASWLCGNPLAIIDAVQVYASFAGLSMPLTTIFSPALAVHASIVPYAHCQMRSTP